MPGRCVRIGLREHALTFRRLLARAGYGVDVLTAAVKGAERSVRLARIASTLRPSLLANRRSVMVPSKASSSFDQKTAIRLDGFAESVAFQGLRLR